MRRSDGCSGGGEFGAIGAVDVPAVAPRLNEGVGGPLVVAAGEQGDADVVAVGGTAGGPVGGELGVAVGVEDRDDLGELVGPEPGVQLAAVLVESGA